MEHHRPNKRQRSAIACDACRARRTKCDSQKPSCRYCQTRALDCVYQEPPAEPPSRVEEELDAVKQRLDHLISLIQPAPPISQGVVCFSDPRDGHETLAVKDNSPTNLPSKLLVNPSVLHVLGLDTDFAQALIRRERAASCEGQGSASPRTLVVHHGQAVAALAAFSARVHIWYPILPLDFSSEYFRILSGDLLPSSDSCLALLVAAVGSLAQDGGPGADASYFVTALASLPIIISECSVRSVQCLVLISLYYCCSLNPCQAQEYCLIASSKIQNIIKSGWQGDENTAEFTRRAYWGVLLLEREVHPFDDELSFNSIGSEVTGQLDVAQSNIWCLDEHVPLPLYHHIWQFTPDSASPGIASTISNGAISIDGDGGVTGSYSLAEIAMRRMLHRCNTAVQATPSGEYVYAPGIASELEHQLEEWYSYLPDTIRFDKGVASSPLGLADIPPCPLSNFLRVQYYCCKLSIYWPAVYQVMQDGKATRLLLNHCQVFFNSYVLLMPSIMGAFRDCVVNRWTLFISIFITSVAAMSAANAACLREVCTDQLYECVRLSRHTEPAILQRSPSLMMMQGVLEERLLEAELW